mgnify:CR=1 FL=1|tara:strand:+ start:84 stop:2030 length:1947 start_codon:yes stop_codon:yes gene_type:complete
MTISHFLKRFVISALITVVSYSLCYAVEGMSRSEIKNLQLTLIVSGYEIGVADGIYGNRTDAAAKDYLQHFNVNVSEIEKSLLKYFVRPSPLLSSNFLNSELGQALAISNFLNKDLGDKPIFGTNHALELSKLLNRELSVDQPLTRRELIEIEALISKLPDWRQVKTETVLKATFQIDPKVMSVDEGEICGGKYQEQDFDDGMYLVGNQGLTNMLHQIGDTDGDGVDELLVTHFRFFFDEEMTRENKDKFWQSPSLLSIDIENSEVSSGFEPNSIKNANGFENGIWTRHVEAHDFDGDGLIDIYLGDQGTDFRPECGFENQLYKNSGELKFELVASPITQNDYTHALGAADLNDDGLIDIIVGNSPYANSKKMKTCSKIFDQQTTNSSFVLINQGNFGFEKQEFNRNREDLFFSLEAFNVDGKSYAALGQAGKQWYDNAYPKVRIAEVTKNGSFAFLHEIEPPKYFSEDLMPMEFELLDVNNDGSSELFISWQFETNSNEQLDYISSNGMVMGGRYIQVISNPLSKNYSDITDQIMVHPEGMNLRGLGSWCNELYGYDADGDGDKDLLCSSFDQWKRINGKITPQIEPIPVYYENQDGKLEAKFFDSEVKNKNKWLVPFTSGGQPYVAQLEPFTCNEIYVEISRINPN